MRRSTRLLVSIIFPLALVFVPTSTLLPVDHTEIENRRLDPPQVSVDRLIDPDMYVESLRYARDASPARAWLIAAGTGIDFFLLGDSPNPLDVFLGTEGWLYSRNAVKSMCDDRVDSAVDNLVELVDEIEGYGASVVYTVVPSKFVIHPEQLTPSQQELAQCGLATAERLRPLLEATARNGYVDSRGIFEEARKGTVPPYFLTDTHFNYEGSIPWIRELVSSVDPEIWDPTAVVDQGLVAFGGNLGVLVFPGLTEDVRQLVVDRGLPRTPAEQLHGRLSPTQTATERYVAPNRGDHRLIEGRAVMLKDSFGDLPAPSLAQYFSDLTVTDWRNHQSIDYFLELASRADIVIIEIVDEAIFARFADQSLAERLRRMP